MRRAIAIAIAIAVGFALIGCAGTSPLTEIRQIVEAEGIYNRTVEFSYWSIGAGVTPTPVVTPAGAVLTPAPDISIKRIHLRTGRDWGPED